MQEVRITKELAKLAASRGFKGEYCTCGGFPECICKDRSLVPQSHLQKWLRDEKGIHVSLVKYGNSYAFDIEFPDIPRWVGEVYPSYEKALEIGMRIALEKLPICTKLTSPDVE